jgi:hypothetical protein
VIRTLSRCRFLNHSEKLLFNVSRQSVRMLKTRRGEKIGRFHRSDHAAAGFAVDGYSARQHRGSGHVLVQGLRSCQQGCRRRRLGLRYLAQSPCRAECS